MARIAGVELPDKSRIDYALTKIKGVGWTRSRDILKSAKIDSARRLSELSTKEIANIASKLESYKIEGELLRETRSDIQRLFTTGSYRGVRHSRGLPVRGQRTRSNARTRRGKRKTVGSFRKEALTQKKILS
ncbi:MAG: 30S ribosomal protein S13 [Candidatus Woesebacteria bacterium GW2011_GWB1_43_14]|uniref:Small ribosomal subunit protein uS13 n=1 Tax=Candidatus Woesebacteria bacterium GW2011_GWB1_43_14 TaxID=1618578 RepID=A0A0G1DHN5_9BACT|nr:MAG: 30S ribosomal protein S13 [Candidatus Woesebacteria bacterium GW2011_GWA1_39_11b]KKS78040.1 MAG: 30S ribosomal protein S13 [Candidatus Woesebacteria bacterium GW2011_GWC1_42_9]KKS97380.1 MAG: 30S ribosomal protein S13 [Candidatus Woesebacteria bacterium GW2011_GWB1_43_14]